MRIGDVYNTVTELRRRLDTVPDAVYACATENQDEILSLRKDEILLGRNSDGEPFRPTYTADPYFKNQLQADAYANYKQKLEALHNARIEHVLNYPNKDSDTPNLRLTRDRYNSLSFQDQMFIRVDTKSIMISSTFANTSLINAKYHNKVMDLGPGAKEYFWKWLLYPALYSHIWE
jgi:hypothetical protein